MRFVAIDPAQKTVDLIDAKTLTDTYSKVGLDPFQVDHGIIARGIAIVVYEKGMKADPNTVDFFSIGGHLFAGTAVLYAFDDNSRETINLNSKPPVMFYRSAREVEQAIARGEIYRPEIRVNGVVEWSWPHPWEIEP